MRSRNFITAMSARALGSHACGREPWVSRSGVEDLDDRLAFVDPQRHAELLPWVHAQVGAVMRSVVVARAADVDRVGQARRRRGSAKERALAGQGRERDGTRPVVGRRLPAHAVGLGLAPPQPGCRTAPSCCPRRRGPPALLGGGCSGKAGRGCTPMRSPDRDAAAAMLPVGTWATQPMVTP